MDKIKELYSQIYDQNVKKIYRFIFLKVNSEAVAEDLCSETFTKGWEVFNKSEKEIENPQAFLYQIARNLVIDHYRDKGRTQTVSAEDAAVADPANIEEVASLNLEMGGVKSALLSLRNDYQEIIIWHYVNDYSVSEIAQMMGKKEGAVRVQLHRALKSLKDKMDCNKKAVFTS